MFEIVKNPKIDFMGKRRIWMGISLTLIALALVVIPVNGIRKGIEFEGGTEIQVKYAATPDLGAIRSSLDRAGFGGHLVTTIGKPEENEVYIRLTNAEAESGKDSVATKVVEALRGPDVASKVASGLLNLNTVDEATLSSLFQTSPDLTREAADASASAVLAARRAQAIFRSVDDAAKASGVDPKAATLLAGKAFVGPFAVRSQSFIGPAIGKELVQKAIWAVLGSLGGMLVYIWIRFQFQWGLAAVIALVHDTIITLGLFSLLGFEMSLPVVASFLTLIGYSVNDTVVVFDRIRENLRKGGSATDLSKVVNDSINETLSRTLLTSGLTWLVCISLIFLGGPALRDFSFVLVAGILVGTYSSIYIASPILVVWQNFVASRRGGGAPVKAEAATRAPARKVKAAPKR